MPDSYGTPMVRELEAIEHRVLDDIWIGPRRRAIHATLIVVLAASTVMWWSGAAGEQSAHGSNRIPTVTAGILTLAAIASMAALAIRRFRMCCAAAYVCGLAAVFGIGAFWWLHTGRPGAPLTWLAIADVVTVLLAMAWVAVAATPIERSQPEMRAHQLG